MNAQDRKQLEEIRTKVQEAHDQLEELAGDLEDKTANTEEYFEGTEKAETMREQTDLVAGVVNSLEDVLGEFDEASA